MNNDLIRRSDLLEKKYIIRGRLDQWHELWVNANNRKKTYQRKCASCGDIAYYWGERCTYNSCPNCGLKMDRGDD